MEFNPEKIFTSINAEDLQVDDVCVFANDLATLKFKVKNDLEQDTIMAILEDDRERRIVREDGSVYALAYLVERPSKEYRSFQTVQEFMDACKERGTQVYQSNPDCVFTIGGIHFEGDKLTGVQFGDQIVLPSYFCNDYKFLQDNTPCGVSPKQ